MQKTLVLDNSVVMAWCFEDEASAYADNVLEHMVDSVAIVPAIWPLEVGNALLAAERRNSLSEPGRVRFLALLSALPIRIEQESPARMLKEILFLAQELNLSTYDASYLDLAMREGLPLATQDEKLREAANLCRLTVLTL